MVAIFHYQGLFAEKQFFDYGYLAVDVFFVLSGMVLEGMYGASISNGALKAGKFAVLRLRRLYPMVALGMAAVALLNFAGIPDSNVSVSTTGALGRGLLLIPELGTGNAFPANGPLWSLMCEVVVNVLWFVSLRYGGRRALTALTATSVPAALALILMHGGSANFGWQGNGTELLEGCIRALGAFCAGALLTRHRGVVDGAVAQLPIPVVVLLAGALIGSRSVLQMLAPAVSDIVPITGCVVALCALRSWAPPSALVRPFLWLGAISYPAYLLHAPLGRLFLALSRGVAQIVSDPFYGGATLSYLLPPLVGALFLVSLALLATAAHYGYERPLQRLLRERQ
jgi:peptidoglycan/LPS O-acetylase OafA/YrhL